MGRFISIINWDIFFLVGGRPRPPLSAARGLFAALGPFPTRGPCARVRGVFCCCCEGKPLSPLPAALGLFAVLDQFAVLGPLGACACKVLFVRCGGKSPATSCSLCSASSLRSASRITLWHYIPKFLKLIIERPASRKKTFETRVLVFIKILVWFLSWARGRNPHLDL